MDATVTLPLTRLRLLIAFLEDEDYDERVVDELKKAGVKRDCAISPRN